MAHREYYVTGAGSGLGKAVVLALDPKQNGIIINALDIIPKPAEFTSPNIHYRHLDVTDQNAIDRLVKEKAESNKEYRIDLWVHCAGVRGLVPSVQIRSYEDVAKAETLQAMDAATMLKAFEVNTLGFFRLAQAFTPLLLQSAALKEKLKDGEVGKGHVGLDPMLKADARRYHKMTTKVIILGSRMGSIGHNTELGGAYAYRASKAALNAIIKSLSIDVPEVAWTVVHPGRVETGLVQIKEDGAMTTEECLRDLMPLIERIDLSHSGKFLDRFGEEIVW